MMIPRATNGLRSPSFEIADDLSQSPHSQSREALMLIVLLSAMFIPVLAGMLLIRVRLNGGTPDDSASPYIGL
jgi:hypothetical protein